MGKRSTYDWQFHIRQQKSSGLTVKEYSQKQGFTAWSFYMNRKRLQNAQPTDTTVAVKLKQPIQSLQSQYVNKTSFVQFGSIDTLKSDELTVKYPDGTIVHYNGTINLTDLLCNMQRTVRSRH